MSLRCKDLGEHLQQGAFMHLSLVWSEVKQRTDSLEGKTDYLAMQVRSTQAAVHQTVSADKKTMHYTERCLISRVEGS